MNEKFLYPIVVLLSVIIVLVIGVLTHSVVVVALVVLLFLAWFLLEKNNHHKKQEYVLLIDRVEELKKFSKELQILIDSELALVQEDVLRTRNIVSDSINLLQAASLSIQASVILQNDEINSLSVNQGVLQQQKQFNSQAQLLSTGSGSDESSKTIDTLINNNQSMKLNSEKIMQALQFEDIVNQISERVALHISDIQLTANILSNLCNSELSSTFEDDLKKMQADYQCVKEKLSNVYSKKIAAQEDMEEGDIDLF